LQESFHPDVLRNALERDRLFNKLWLAVEHQPHLAQVITYEHACLWDGDIPFFYTRPNSCDLFCGNGECIANFFAISGLELAQLRVQHLNEQDLQRQIWYIDASMSTLALAEEKATWKGYQVFTPKTIPQSQELLTAACAVGDRLDFLALRTSTEANWIGLTLVGGRRWSLSPLGWTLYDGLPGVILFLAYLGDITQESRYTELALLALKTLEKQLQQHQTQIKLIGAFSGWGGIIYTLTHLGVLWKESKLLTEAEVWLEKFQPLISQDQYLDLIDGAAGCLVSILTLYKYAPKDWILDHAIACGERLLECKEPGLGFAHGAAGIAWALLELATISKMDKFREMATKMMLAEHCPNEVAIWCNGASGIGLGRLSSLKHLNEEDICQDIYQDINTALNSTLKSGFGLNHCLCHGDLGNLELLLLGKQNLGDANFDIQIQQTTGMILESINQNGWLCGVPLGVETPGLMTGIAGIGYELLRLFAPDKVPPVVVLAAPYK
jgi:type 2 lantibiotic biosynthesis protein LanM